MSYWQRRLKREVLMHSGEHTLIQGYTGTGKTNLLTWIMQGFLALRQELPAAQWETLVWFDRGKSSELNRLMQLAPCRLLIPEGCDVELHYEENNFDVEKKYFSSPQQVWHLLDRDRINILCLQRFLMDPEQFPSVVGKLFKNLILDSFNYKIHPEGYDSSIMLPPITIVIDEINNVAPSKGQGIGSREESQAGAWIQQNMEQLRSQKIRLIGSTHAWRKLRPGVRSSFPCHIALTGANYPSNEKPKIARFNALFEKLETGQAIFIFRKDIFSDLFMVPWMGTGEEHGYILYNGQMKREKKEKALTNMELTAALINALKTQTQEAET